MDDASTADQVLENPRMGVGLGWVSLFASTSTEETSKNQEIFILIKEGESWKISRYIFNSLQNQHPVIDNFEECIAAGNPALESFPRQCIAQDGKHFVEEIT